MSKPPTAPRIILVNGPPQSGKDTVGAMLQKRLPKAMLHKFAGPLKGATAYLYRELACGAGMPNYTHEFHEVFEDGKRKNEPHPGMFGITPRQALIAVSEQLLKKIHGEAFFGELAAGYIERTFERGVAETFVITDSGFVEEAVVLVDRFGAANVTVIEISRNGASFEGDSRSYIGEALHDCRPGITICQMCNNGGLDDLRRVVEEAIVPGLLESFAR